MKTSISENFRTNTLPYWLEGPCDQPSGLQRIISELCISPANPWLVFPFEGVGGETWQEHAIRCVGDRLDICMAVPVDGRQVIQLTASDCGAVQWVNSLLHSELALFGDDDALFRIRYNAVADPKVKRLLLPFLASCFVPAMEPPLPTAICPPLAMHRFSEGLQAMFSGHEGYVSVVQAASVTVKNKSWFRRKAVVVPASAVALSASRLVVMSGEINGREDRYGVTATALPLSSLHSVSCADEADGTIRMDIRFGKEHSLTTLFRETMESGVRDQIDRIVSACSTHIRVGIEQKTCALAATERPGPTFSSISARQELLGLTGVSLSETEAHAALVQIHEFKWLEAERAGFDTWAVIQPGCPLRAAAVHWVRKHFSDFADGMRVGGHGQSVA